jgi:hypothetical protein
MGTTSSFCSVACLGEIDRPGYYDKIQSGEINKLFSQKRERATPDTRLYAGGSTDVIRLFMLGTKACTSAKCAFPLRHFTCWHFQYPTILFSEYCSCTTTYKNIKADLFMCSLRPWIGSRFSSRNVILIRRNSLFHHFYHS